jgi:hypothetical protein
MACVSDLYADEQKAKEELADLANSPPKEDVLPIPQIEEGLRVLFSVVSQCEAGAGGNKMIAGEHGMLITDLLNELYVRASQIAKLEPDEAFVQLGVTAQSPITAAELRAEGIMVSDVVPDGAVIQRGAVNLTNEGAEFLQPFVLGTTEWRPVRAPIDEEKFHAAAAAARTVERGNVH